MAELCALVDQLPREGALARALGLWWTDELELSAVNAEIAVDAIRVAMRLGGVNKAKLPRRLQIPRPKQVSLTDPIKIAPPVKRRPATVDEVRSILQLVHGKKG